MQFNSYIFILLFLPLTVCGYFGLNRLGKEKAAKIFLLLMSLWFYGYFNPSYLLIIVGSILANFCISKAMERAEDKPKKLLLILGIIFNVGLIFYFKYYDFFISNINIVFGSDFILRHIVLPLGISFFTFQQISFVVDSYRGQTKGYSFWEYALFVAFFPQLVAGPIVLHSELIPQFRDESRWKPDFDNLSKGLMMFARGLAKKVLIADTFGGAVSWGFNQAAAIPAGEGALTSPEIIIVMLSYTFQIYFDFSGYSDMATGLSAMFNLQIPQNFNSPYKALSIADFWKRWHMTLTRFLTNYVYIPLGGNRKGKARTYLNTMIVFLVSGIWHGANWTFILWGVIHGLFQCINKAGSGLYNKLMEGVKKLPAAAVLTWIVKAIQWFVTFVVINVAWLLFRADSVTQFIQIMKRLPVYNYDIRTELLESFRIPKIRYLFMLFGGEPSEMFTLGFCTVVAFVLALIMVLAFPNNYECKYKKTPANLIITWVLMVICIISLSRISTFLYFNF
jgi:D-alanyl-lipoteichoic acid acyltransferase DltB (MBOAT superfamily)